MFENMDNVDSEKYYNKRWKELIETFYDFAKLKTEDWILSLNSDKIRIYFEWDILNVKEANKTYNFVIDGEKLNVYLFRQATELDSTIINILEEISESLDRIRTTSNNTKTEVQSALIGA